MSGKIPTWVWLAGLAGAGYALYRLSAAFKQGLTTVTQPVSDVIANAAIGLDKLFGDSPVTVAGSAVFPNGARVPLSNLTVAPYNGPNGFEARVSYQGRTWRLAPHDANGNYPATPV